MKFRFLSALTILMAVLGAAGGAEWAAALASRPASAALIYVYDGAPVDAVPGRVASGVHPTDQAVHGSPGRRSSAAGRYDGRSNLARTNARLGEEGRADEEAARLKDSQHALELLTRFVECLDGPDRKEAEAVLTEWIFSEDPRRQFDALASVERLQIRSAVPALRGLAAQFEGSSAPSAPYDWAWVNRILGQFAQIHDEPDSA